MWNSFREFVTRGAQTQPLLLVLEDLHWADDSTLLLTEYLAPLLPEVPVRIIGTYRDDEIDISHPLSRVIHQLGRRRLIDRISLRRLSFGSPSHGRGTGRAAASRGAGRVIDSETEGNPFFVEELYLHLAESECCSTSAGGYERTSKSPRPRYRKASGWSSGSGSRGCPVVPARRWSRRRCPAGSSPLISLVRWPVWIRTPLTTPSRRPKEHAHRPGQGRWKSRVQSRAPAELAG